MIDFFTASNLGKVVGGAKFARVIVSVPSRATRGRRVRVRSLDLLSDPAGVGKPGGERRSKPGPPWCRWGSPSHGPPRVSFRPYPGTQMAWACTSSTPAGSSNGADSFAKNARPL